MSTGGRERGNVIELVALGVKKPTDLQGFPVHLQKSGLVRSNPKH